MNTVSKRILCLDADDDFSYLLSLILKREGFEVIVCKTITEAIHLAKKEQFTLFLVSGKLPDGEGIDFVHLARSHTTNIPIVLISGWASKEDIKAGLDAGASAYLIMPVENGDVIQTVKSLIAPGASNTA